MANIKKKVDNLENRVTTLEQQVNSVLTKLDMFIAESREARKRQDDDMREMREKHDSDMREMRKDMKEMQVRFYEKMDNMDTKIDGIGNHVRNITIAAMVGIGAAVTGVAAMVVAVFLK